MRLLYWFRVHVKLILRRFMVLDGFCRRCGRNFRDFVVPDDVGEQVSQHIQHGNALCYDCFCDTCMEIGLPGIWQLEKLPWHK